MEYLAEKAAGLLAIGEETTVAEILAMLNFDATQFNDVVQRLADDHDVFLTWEDQPSYTEIWDGAPRFTGSAFIYEGCSGPSGDGVSVSAPLPLDARLSIVG